MSENFNIHLNGALHEVVQGTSLRQLVEHLKFNHGRIAIEVNKEIVSRSEHESFLLSENDKVEIIHAIGGG